MKKILFSLFCLLSATAIYADMIITKSGQTLTVYNIEVSPTSIFYTEEPSTDSPLKKIATADVFGYKIGNGEMQTPGAPQPSALVAASPASASSAPSRVVTVGDDYNGELIASYSAGEYGYDKKFGKKDAKNAIAFWSLSKESVLSNGEIEIFLESGMWTDTKQLWLPFKDLNSLSNAELRIGIKNKTDRPIYIDLAQTFRDGEISGGHRVFYDGTQTVQGGASSTGAGVSVMGIGIGGSSTSSSSIVKSQQSVLTIPAKVTLYLPSYSVYNEYTKKNYEQYDIIGGGWYTTPAKSFASKIEDMKEGQVVTYSQEETPTTIDYSMTYSFDKDGAEQRVVNFQLYISQLIGLKSSFNIWSGKYEDPGSRLLNADDKTIVSTIKLKD